jgi:hypothetical protein
MAEDIDATRKKGGKGRPGGAKSDAEAGPIKEDTAGAEAAADAGFETTAGPDIEAAVEQADAGGNAVGPGEETEGDPTETGGVKPVGYAELFRFHRTKKRR